MESIAFFEKKVNLRPEDLNLIDEETTVQSLLERKIKMKLENRCSEHGYVINDSVKLISHSVGYFESARFTGDAVYYVKAEGRVLYPVDDIVVDGKVARKNKMGLYLIVKEGIHVQVPRDLNMTDVLREEFEQIQLGDEVRVTLKKSLFQINDAYILTNGIFMKKVGGVSEEDLEDAFEDDGILATNAVIDATSATVDATDATDATDAKEEAEAEAEAEEEAEEEENENQAYQNYLEEEERKKREAEEDEEEENTNNNNNNNNNNSNNSNENNE